MLKKVLIAALALLLIGVTVGYFMYNKPHRNIQSEEALYTGDTSGLKAKLDEGIAYFDSVYVQEVVDVSGNITGVGETSVTIDHIVICSMDTVVDMSQFQRGNDLRVKARVAGAEEDLIEGYIIRLDKARPVLQ